MVYRLKAVIIITAITTLITCGCAGASLPEQEPEENVVSTPVEPEEDIVIAPVEEKSEEISDDSDAEIDGVTGASATPDQKAAVTSVVAIISGAEAREIYESNDSAILLDVRNQDEFDEVSIPGSILIPVDELESRLSELPDKDTVIIVYCRAGRRSEIASDILAENGFTSIFNMETISNWG